MDKYEKAKNISTVTGYSFQNTMIKNANIKENFFLLKRPSSWGWATWRNKWISINNIKLSHQFNDKDYGNDLIIMSKKKNKGILNSWAYDWTIKHIKNDKFCIYPKFSMIKNHGFDSNATNNLFRDKKFYSKIKNSTFKNYIYQSENKNIKNLSKLNYDINPLMFIVKLIYFTLFYEKSKK